ncbi:ATP synthase F0 subunit A [Streptomyces sp. CC53]|uniref:F0F1 ATP synthase subunit A n=1 Tax=unclassified Streptomyces TaxID=2593676 RepID=UPI0008DE68B6|nr:MULTISPECIES: F0F1 ATP synthase subunit A [unclassified Streptomyces]OII64698.1 ATP synthase F0 subunit A [Streptomyces sp. CC53]OII69672.1 ATP synthase F0 subunit A [Streptomyces sp. CC77]
MQKELLVTADAQTLAFEVDCHLFQDCGFPAPSVWSFIFEPIFEIGPVEFNKPMLLAIIGTFGIIAFFWAAFGNAKVVPGKLQMVAEALYEFVRQGVAREVIGKKGEPFVPLLVSLFFFVWMLNLWALVPLAQFPVSSVIAYPVGLALLVWITYMTVTFRTNGLVGGFRNLCVPSGLPKPIYVLLTPLEFVSNVFVRPFTLAVRLFANMFAGHILILIFTIATWYMLGTVLGTVYASASFLMTLVLTVFELFIQALQAYVFTVLTATYLSQALEEAH